jgi:hypothetical protein
VSEYSADSGEFPAYLATAIDDYRNCHWANGAGDYDADDSEGVRLQLEAAIRRYAAPSWIDAEARKPDESTHVLAAFKNGDIEIAWFEGGDWWGSDRGDEPTHWMPLPITPASSSSSSAEPR